MNVKLFRSLALVLSLVVLALCPCVVKGADIVHRAYSCDSALISVPYSDNVFSAVPITYVGPSLNTTCPPKAYANASWHCFSTPESVAKMLQKLPKGGRSITFEGGHSLYDVVDAKTGEAVFQDVDPSTGVVLPFVDGWARVVKERVTQWFAAFQAAQGEVDVILLDYENGGHRYWYNFINQASGDVLLADARWPDLKAQLNDVGKPYEVTFEDDDVRAMSGWTSATLRAQVWTHALAIDDTAAKLNSSVVEPIMRAGYADVRISNFAHGYSTDVFGDKANRVTPEQPTWWPRTTCGAKSPVGGGSMVGNRQTTSFYGKTNDIPTIYTQVGGVNGMVGDRKEIDGGAFEAVVANAAMARDATFASPNALWQPWIEPRNGSLDGKGESWLNTVREADNATHVQGMWFENVFHVWALTGATDWFWWRPGSNRPETSGYDDISAALHELDALVSEAIGPAGCAPEDVRLAPNMSDPNTQILGLDSPWLLSAIDVSCSKGSGGGSDDGDGSAAAMPVTTVYRFTPKCIWWPCEGNQGGSCVEMHHKPHGQVAPSWKVGSGVSFMPSPTGAIWTNEDGPVSYSGFWILQRDYASPHTATESPPAPPPAWGGYPQWRSTVHMENPADDPTRPLWIFNYTYDAAGADLYNHGAGNGDETCKWADVTPGEACSVLSALDKKTYVWSETSPCCELHISLFNVRPFIRSDWLARDHATYNGTAVVSGVQCDVWVAKGAYTNHYACTNDGNDRPVRFWEHKGDKLKAWNFTAYERFTDEHPLPADALKPPAQCDGAPRCKKSSLMTSQRATSILVPRHALHNNKNKNTKV